MSRKKLAERHFWYYCLIASSGLAIAATLTPFNFDFSEPTISSSLILERFERGSTIKDYWRNILLFLPFGFSLGAVLSTKVFKYLNTLIIAVITSCALSLFVETLQLFLPSRVSNFSDVATNTIGGILGFNLYWWRQTIIALVISIFSKNRNKSRLKPSIAAFSCYFLALLLATYIILININFSNWNDNFPLIIGNEATGDRPWQGYIKSLQWCDRALSFTEIEQTFIEKTMAYHPADFVVSYLFDRQQANYSSLTDSASDLVWQGNLSSNDNLLKQIENNSVFVSGDRWLISSSPATKLIHKLQNANRFTLSVVLATDLTQQTGPARIVSISESIIHRNLTIGQEQSNLNFRLRSPITGDNGSQPELVIPRVFSDTNFHHLLITFENNKLNFYLDSSANSYSFLFQPEINFLSYYPFTILNWQINLADFSKLKYYLTFYGIVFIPLGIIGKYILSLIGSNTVSKVGVIFICLLPPILFEIFYVLVEMQPFRTSNLLLSIIIMSIVVSIVPSRRV